MTTQRLARTRRSPHRLRHQRGFGILQASLLVLLVGGAVVAGFTLLGSRTPVSQTEQQEATLRWADEALAAYAAAHARLPCPVATPTSAATDCVAAGQKGWLPARALEAVHPGGLGPTPALRYMVYQGSGSASDLTLADNAFSPHRWDRTPHTLTAVNGLDLCAKLANAARETAASVRTDRARTLDLGGNMVNVAYGIAAPGPTPGDPGGRFDGINQNNEARLEAPSRRTDSGYDDRVRVRAFNALAQTLGCGYASASNPDGVVLAALDMMALAVGISDEVTEQHESNREDTQLAVAMAGVSEAFAIINVALAAAGIVNSVSTLATASAQLAAAIASCAVLVGCGLIPPYTAAVTAASVAIGLGATATGLAAGALAATTAALVLTIQARDMAAVGIGSTPADLAAAAAATCLAAEGGLVHHTTDASGNLSPLVPPQWRDGLRQGVAATQAELTNLIALESTNRNRLNVLERIPSTHLINYEPAPVRAAGESDSAWTARWNAWLARRQAAEAQLVAKLAAIRVAMQARFDWDTATQAAENARNERDQMQSAVDQLGLRVAACTVSPPVDLVGIQTCTNQRRALQGMATCDADILTAAQVARRQCLPWKEADLAAAINARAAAHNAFIAAEDAAIAAPQPSIRDYIEPHEILWFGVVNCTDFWLGTACRELIVRNQPEWDKRETYAMLYYRWLGMGAALREKQAELDEKQRAYDAAMAQCNVLRNIATGGSTPGTEMPPVWAGAAAILAAADCRGATGAVQPATCGAAP